MAVRLCAFCLKGMCSNARLHRSFIFFGFFEGSKHTDNCQFLLSDETPACSVVPSLVFHAGLHCAEVEGGTW